MQEDEVDPHEAQRLAYLEGARAVLAALPRRPQQYQIEALREWVEHDLRHWLVTGGPSEPPPCPQLETEAQAQARVVRVPVTVRR